MIATVKPCPHDGSVPTWHESFLEMLPTIQRYAQVAFRGLDSESREDLVEEVVANSAAACKRLFEQGRESIVYPTVLAKYGIAQVREGRKLGNKHSRRDVLSRYAQRTKGFVVETLDGYGTTEDGWLEVAVEDRNAGPAEVAITRIDFADWLNLLPKRQRQIATTLATGETTGRTARRFGVSHSRISQVRRELSDAWRRFQSADSVANQTAAATA